MQGHDFFPPGFFQTSTLLLLPRYPKMDGENNGLTLFFNWDDLIGKHLFLETPIYIYIHIYMSVKMQTKTRGENDNSLAVTESP